MKRLPETVKVNGKLMPIYDFMLQKCESKRALHKWIKLFLGLDMPDCIVCEESSASPMDMIWTVYKAALTGDPKMASQLYFASRDSFKTLSAAIIEVLMLVHFRRTASHMGAIIQQSKKCYDYFQKFFRRPVLNKIVKEKDTMERTELILDSPWDMNPYLQIVRCTMAGANSEHTHNFTVDEVDVVQNIQAYREAKKIPTETPDKKPSITLYISTRKSAFGLVQQEVDNAKDTGLNVFSWNIIDVTEACPKSKNKMDEGTVNLYYKQDELELLQEIEYNRLTEIQKADYVKKTMYPGCVGCNIAPLCLGRLATKQKSKSSLLKSHNDVAKKFRESEIGDAIAQLMCLKPSTHGIVFTQFSSMKSVMSATQMWEKFMGEKATHEISKEELIETFQKYNIPAFAGIDWGWDAPNVCLVMYIDGKQNIYIVHELSLTHTDQPEFIDIIKRQIHPKYKIQMYYPDTEDPSSINLLKKADLPVSSKVDKKIHPGIQTMKKYIKVPGLGITKFFVLGDGSCKGLLDELNKYHLLLDAAGQIIAYNMYSEEFDHRIDAARYVIHTRLGKFNAQIAMGEIPKSGPPPVTNRQGNFTRTPTATELARHLGRDDFRDNRNDDPDTPKNPKSGGDDGGFNWSFIIPLAFLSEYLIRLYGLN